MPTSEQVHTAIKNYASAVAAGDKEAIVACFAQDAVVVDPYPGPAHVGTEAIGNFWDQVMALGAPVAFLVEKTVVCADRAVFLFAVTIVSGGARYGVVGMDVVTVDEAGLIAELVAYWDPSQLSPLAD